MRRNRCCNPSELISTDADNTLALGADGNLFVPAGGGGAWQFYSGTDSPPVTAPSNNDEPARYYNTSNKFYWDWDIGTQAWVVIPRVYKAILRQQDTDPPNVDYLVANTFGGTPVWGYVDVGQYTLTITGAFTGTIGRIDYGVYGIFVGTLDVDTVGIYIYYNGVLEDDRLYTTVTIEMYP